MTSFLSIRRSAFLVVLLASLAIVGRTPHALAFSVSPVLFDRTVDPGTSEQGTVQVVNDTSGKQTYYASVQNFAPQGEEGQQTFLPESDTSGLVTWLTLDRTSVTLSPGESQEFRWALNVPKNAEPGGHYAALFFSTVPPREQGGSGVGVGAKTGVLFLVNVNGNVREAAFVESFTVVSDENPVLAVPMGVINRLPALFELRVRNDGSVHFAPRGTIVITNMFGNTLAEVGANPLGSRVLPNSTRRIRSSWGPAVPTGAGFIDKLKAEWAGFAIGRYTATLRGAYGSQGAPLAASVSFWIVPWRLLLAALVGIIALLFLIKGYNKLVVRGAMSRAGKKK